MSDQARITNANCDGMARRLAAGLTAACGRDVQVSWGQPYGHVYHVEQAGTQLALTATSVTKRGCYEAMYAACVALEAAAILRDKTGHGVMRTKHDSENPYPRDWPSDEVRANMRADAAGEPLPFDLRGAK